MQQLKPNDQRAQMALTLIWIVLGFELAMLLSDFFQYQLLDKIANGGEISDQEANSNDTRQQILAIAYLLFFVISAVTFILWFRRAYFNLHQKVKHLDFGEEWAANGWFVPGINLVRPYKIMKELFLETEEYLEQQSKNFVKGRPNGGLLLTWWILWLSSGVIGQILFRLDGETVDELINTTLLKMFSEAIGIILALVTIKMIKQYVVLENQLINVKEDVLP